MKSVKVKKPAQQTAIGSKVINARLFFEGVKRLRVIALAVAIIALTASILVPVLSWISHAERYERSCWEEYPVYGEDGTVIDWKIEYVEKEIVPSEIESYQLCPPLYALPFAAPLFFFILFSFLHKRKQSDFFHAIPYTRTCVFVSFTTAALAFVAAITVLSALLSGLIYAACPFTTFAFGDLAGTVGISFLSAAFLSSFMMLSLSVTGTGATTFLLFLLFASITRITLGLFALSVGNVPLVDPSYYPFLSPFWYLPLRMFIRSTDYYDEAVPTYARLVPYTIVVTLLIFALAGFLYKIRRSEMAERSAPSRRLQSIFRCLFTLPFALLLTTMIVMDEIDIETFLLLAVLTLVAFYLYELITTRRARNLIRATPWLGAVAGGAVAFAISFVIFAAVVQAPIPKEKIATVSVETTSESSFESINVKKIESDDERLITLVADSLEFTRKGQIDYTNVVDYRTVTIRRTNGTAVKRNIAFTTEADAMLENYLVESDEYSEKYLELPPIDSISYSYSYTEGASNYYDFHFETEEFKAFWAILSKEYETLPLADKLLFKDGFDRSKYKGQIIGSASDEENFNIEVETYSPLHCTLYVSGEYRGESYRSYYVIPASMTETIDCLLSQMADSYKNHYASDYLYETYGVKEIGVQSGTDVTRQDVAEAIYRDLASGNLDFENGRFCIAAYMKHELTMYVTENEAVYAPFFAKLEEYVKTRNEPQEGKIPVLLTSDLANYDELYSEAYSSFTVYLTEEEYKDLLALVHVSLK